MQRNAHARYGGVATLLLPALQGRVSVTPGIRC